MRKIKVSVIIPYFNKEKFFEKTIESVINQSHTNLEIIIIFDDHKKNLKFVKKIVSLDKRIRLIINTKNLGAGLSRNIGIGCSKGEYLAFIDADDLWKKNKIEYQLKYMLKKNIFYSHTSYEIIRENNRKTNKIIIAKKTLSYKDLIKSCDIGLSTVMIKKSIMIKNYKFAKLKTKEDYVLWLKILKDKKYFDGINKNLTYWRKTNNSLSSSNFQKIIDGYRVYKNYLNFTFFKSVICLLILSFNALKK